MFDQNQLIQLEYAVKYVIGDLENVITTTEDAEWYGSLCSLLAHIQIEQSKTSEAD